MPIPSARQKALRLAARNQGVTTREIAAAGIHRQALTRLVEAGKLERVARGVYQVPEQAVTEHHGLVLASIAIPQATVCLLSALQFHNVGTQLPAQVWIAIDRRARQSSLKYPPLRVMRYSGKALTAGVETHRLEGRAVRVYSVAKTLADCFKYRNKIGLDVALDAARSMARAPFHHGRSVPPGAYLPGTARDAALSRWIDCMSSKRDGPARSLQVQLSRHARAIGVDPNLVMTRFAVERLLYRLSLSPHAERFLLKGALLMLAWLGDTLRPTRDADLPGFGDLEDDDLRRIFIDICRPDVVREARLCGRRTGIPMPLFKYLARFRPCES